MSVLVYQAFSFKIDLFVTSKYLSDIEWFAYHIVDILHFIPAKRLMDSVWYRHEIQNETSS